MKLKDLLEQVKNLPEDTAITFFYERTIFLDRLTYQTKNPVVNEPPEVTLYFDKNNPEDRHW